MSGTLARTLRRLASDVLGSVIVPRVSKTSRRGPMSLLPPLSPGLERLRSFYRLATLPDGFPGREEKDGSITPHPIYGTYVLLDYTKQFASRPSTRLHDAISLVARASVARMEPIEDALAFYYDNEEHPVSRQPNRHYSGLTQAYYAVALYRAYAATNDPFLKTAANRVFNSLLIPENRGGVLYRWKGGVALAEVPTRPKDLILNGWLSILHSVGEYAAQSGDRRAASLVRRSSITLAKLLPLFDAPAVSNSRYSLTGPAYLRLRFGARPDGVAIRRLRFSVPEESSFKFAIHVKPSRWQNYLTHANEDVEEIGADRLRLRRAGIRMNAVLSRLGYPTPNRVTFVIDTPRRMPISLSAYIGNYSPRTSAPIDRAWVETDAIVVEQGRHTVELELGWTAVDLVAYPTNFIKEIDGRPTNVYHMVHIKRLRELYTATHIPALADWADRWEDYVLRWNRMPRYRGLFVRNYFLDIPKPALDLPTFRRRVVRERKEQDSALTP